MAGRTEWRMVAWCLLGLVLNVQRAMTSQEIMTKMSLEFSKALDQCKSEMNLGDHIMADLYNFWREEYELLNNDTGCAIMCMAAKLNLVTEDNGMHHENALSFAKKHGADDDLAKSLIAMIHDCEKQFADITDECKQTLEVAKCFRTKIHGLKWAPSMETVLEEVMVEVKQ